MRVAPCDLAGAIDDASLVAGGEEGMGDWIGSGEREQGEAKQKHDRFSWAIIGFSRLELANLGLKGSPILLIKEKFSN